MHRPTRLFGELDRTSHLTRPFGELDSWTSPQGLLLWVLIWIPIEKLFVLSQSEFPLKFYDKNKLDAQHPARNQVSWIPQRLLLCVLFWIPIETLFVSSQSELPLRFYDKKQVGFTPSNSPHRRVGPAPKGSSFALFFESRSKRFLFLLNQNFRWDFTTKTNKTCLNSLACSYSPSWASYSPSWESYSPLPPSLRPPSNLDQYIFCFVSIGVTIGTLR